MALPWYSQGPTSVVGYFCRPWQCKFYVLFIVVMLTFSTIWSTWFSSSIPAGKGRKDAVAFSPPLSESKPIIVATESPVLLQFDVCPGFAEQQLQLVKALMIGSELGAQVVLTSGEGHVWDILHLEGLADLTRTLYRESACAGPPGEHRKFWCSPTRVSGILMLDKAQSSDLLQSRSKSYMSAPAAAANDGEVPLAPLRKKLWSSIPSVARVTCNALSSLPIVEPGVEWDLFWTIWASLRFKEEVESTKESIMELMAGYAADARRKAQSMGFKTTHTDSTFNVLHLRAEADWLQFCGSNNPQQLGNCRSNTFEVGNVLLSEGISPSMPLYMASRVSKSQLERWRDVGSPPNAADNLFGIYTVVSQEMLSKQVFENWQPELRLHKMFWPAVSFLLSTDAHFFIGNSVSTFSGLLMQLRMRSVKPRNLHYNGGTVKLQETKQLAAKKTLKIPLFRSRIKWFFCIQPKAGQALDEKGSSSNMAKVAIRSAFARTSLVPVGITTASPTSKFAIDLVASGARLIYHTPSWVPHIKAVIAKWEGSENRFAGNKKPSHLLSDVDAMVGTFLRIDIPILGLLDPLAFYADVDVLFQNDVTWPALLGMSEKSFSKKKYTPYEQQSFAKPGQEGIPKFFAMSAETQMEKVAANAGVMLWNVQSMREAYPKFLEFIVNSSDITWPVGPGDQGALRTFFKGERGPSYLPYIFNWKAYWPSNRAAVLIHFHGPKCETDILPFLRTGEVRLPLFQGLLKMCHNDGGCLQLCNEYMNFLTLSDKPGQKVS